MKEADFLSFIKNVESINAFSSISLNEPFAFTSNQALIFFDILKKNKRIVAVICNDEFSIFSGNLIPMDLKKELIARATQILLNPPQYLSSQVLKLLQGHCIIQNQRFTDTPSSAIVDNLHKKPLPKQSQHQPGDSKELKDATEYKELDDVHKKGDSKESKDHKEFVEHDLAKRLHMLSQGFKRKAPKFQLDEKPNILVRDHDIRRLNATRSVQPMSKEQYLKSRMVKRNLVHTHDRLNEKRWVSAFLRSQARIALNPKIDIAPKVLKDSVNFGNIQKSLPASADNYGRPVLNAPINPESHVLDSRESSRRGAIVPRRQKS